MGLCRLPATTLPFTTPSQPTMPTPGLLAFNVLGDHRYEAGQRKAAMAYRVPSSRQIVTWRQI